MHDALLAVTVAKLALSHVFIYAIIGLFALTIIAAPFRAAAARKRRRAVFE